MIISIFSAILLLVSSSLLINEVAHLASYPTTLGEVDLCKALRHVGKKTCGHLQISAVGSFGSMCFSWYSTSNMQTNKSENYGKNPHNLFPKNECFLVSAFLHHITCLEGEGGRRGGGGEVENGRTRLRKGRFFPSLLSLRAQFSSLPSLQTASAQASFY